jgi:hypothetical protein
VTAAYLVGANFDGLTNSYMTPEQRASLDHGSEEYTNRVWGSKIQVIGWSLYAAILWCLKLCIAAVYARLTYEHRVLLPFSPEFRRSLTFGLQEWNLPPRNTRAPGLWHSAGDLHCGRPHDLMLVSTVPPFLADLA